MKCKCSSPSVVLAAHCATLVALVAARPAHAQQFVLLDTTYTATEANTQRSELAAEPEMGIPNDLLEPVAYANGSIHVALEVLEKPSTQRTLYNICLENSSDYACLPYVMYSDTGNYRADAQFDKLWHYDAVDWSQGIDRVRLILKNSNEQLVQGNSEFYPYKVHVTLTVVAPGSTFDPTQPHTMPSTAGSSGSSSRRGDGGDAGDGGSAGQAGSGSEAAQTSTDTGKDMELPSASAGISATAGTAGAATGAQRNAQGAAAGGATGTSTARSTLSAGTGASSDGEPRTISSQLENTGGCAVIAAGGYCATQASLVWSLLAVGLVLVGQRKRR